MSMFKFVKSPKLWIFLAALTISLGVAAQTHYKPHVWVGGRAGVSLGRQDIAPAVPQKWNMATSGAITLRYSEEKLFGLVAELGWSQRGWKENFEEAPLSYSRTLTFITLPVMTHINFGSERMKCFFNLGPEIAYLVGESISANFDYKDISSVKDWPTRPRQTEQLAKPIDNKFDYGITAGVGCEFYIKPGNSVTLEARYYFGLGNIFNSSKADTFSASRSTSIEVCLGYNFLLK